MDNSIVYQSSSMFVRLLQGLMNTKVYVSGLENIPKNTTLFVSNHFTRTETFIIPNVIYKRTDKIVRSLANYKIFTSNFGAYLRKLGTISTKEHNRDNIILGDLVSGKHNWLIYPEGHMVKSKKITKVNMNYVVESSSSEREIHTGSALLAIKSELLRNELKELLKLKDKEGLKKFYKNYEINPKDNLIDLPTAVVPVTVTYIPIRPGENTIAKIALKFMDKLSNKLKEELEIEGNILLHSEINIHFGKATYIDEFLKKSYKNSLGLPFGGYIQPNIVVGQGRFELTRVFMNEIYKNIIVHFDHVVAIILFNYPYETITKTHLKLLIYMAINFLHTKTESRLHDNISKERSFLLLLEDEHDYLENILSLAQSLGVISNSVDENIDINQKQLHKSHSFHNIRIHNTLAVIKNEVMLMNNFVEYVKKMCILDIKTLRDNVDFMLDNATCSLLYKE